MGQNGGASILAFASALICVVALYFSAWLLVFWAINCVFAGAIYFIGDSHLDRTAFIDYGGLTLALLGFAAAVGAGPVAVGAAIL